MSIDSHVDPWKCVFVSKTYRDIVYAFGGNTTKILNISNVNDIRIISEIRTASNELKCNGIFEVSKTLFIGISEQIFMIDVANLTDPVVLKMFATGETRWYKSHDKGCKALLYLMMGD